MNRPACAGAILAGGRSRRMGGGLKALAPLAGAPLLQHVIDRMRAQVDVLFLSVERPLPDFEPFGLEQVPDPRPGSRGPLGGLAAALRRASDGGSEWLLLAPCDAPFLPADLASRLHGEAVTAGVPAAAARDETGLQPTFSIWHRDLLADLETAVLGGMAGFRQFLGGHAYAAVDWPAADPGPFFNINDRAALERANATAAGTTGIEP